MKFYYISTKHIIQTRRYFCEQKLFHSISKNQLLFTKIVSFNFKEPTFVHKNCINIIENRFKEPSIRLFFTERTTFSSFDTNIVH